MRYLTLPFDRLDFEWSDAPPPLEAEELAEVARFIAEQRARTSLFFDGPLLVCSRAEVTDERALLRVARSSYGPYAWARSRGIERPGLYAVGTGVLIFERFSRSYAFFERGHGVQFDRARIGAIGGVATPPTQAMHDRVREHLVEESAREVDEELALPSRVDRSALRYLGAYVDERTTKLEVLFSVSVERCELSGEENTRIVRVARGGLRRFAANNEQRIESSTLAHLRHIAAQLDREC